MAITAVEMRRVARDRAALLFVVLLPIALTLVVGATVFGAATAAVTVGYLGPDQSTPSRELADRLDASAGVEVRQYDDRDELLRHVRQGRVTAAVLVPARFGETGDPDTVELVTVPGSGRSDVVRAALGSAVAAGSRTRAVDGAADRFDLDPEAAREAAADLARTGSPAVVVTTASGDEPAADVNRFTYTTVGNLVLFVFANTVAGGAALVESRRLGVARRMCAAPVTTSAIVGGTLVSRAVFAVLQSALLLVVGIAVFGVGFGDPVAAALLVVVYALVSASVGVLVGSSSSSAEQAAAVAVPVSIGLGMLGGTMWPLSIVGPTMRAIGHVTPQAWAMDAWSELTFDGGSVTSVAGELAVLSGYVVVLGATAAVVLHRRLLR